MPRYIDAYAIKYFVSVTNEGRFYRVAFKDEIDKIPTADVVPTEFHDKCLEIEIQKRMNMVEVVRCKDCRYYRKGFNEEEYWSVCTVNPWNYPTTDDENYCSYAERREDDNG